VNDNYGYDPNRTTYYDPTINNNIYPPATAEYPPEPQQMPPTLQPPTTLGNLPPSQPATTVQPIYVPYPVVISDAGDGMALSSLILGIVSAAIGWIPICGVAALLPAILGIVFGGLGMKSQRRRGMAMAGMVLSMLAIAMAFIFFI
jgi:hypothetical protein